MAVFRFVLEGTGETIFEMEREFVPNEDDIIYYHEDGYKVKSVTEYLEADDDYNPVTNRTKSWNVSKDLYKVYVEVL